MDNGPGPLPLTNRDLLLPYIAPYFAYVFIASFLGRFVALDISYVIRILVVPVILAWAWRWYLPLAGPQNRFISVLVGIAAGLVGLILWIGLLKPFVGTEEGAAWSLTGFGLRLAAATFIVPVFEEVFVRGYLFRVALQWDLARRADAPNPFETAFDRSCLNDLAPGAWSLWAVLISSVAFALGHRLDEWLAAFAYSLLMAAVMIVRKDLLSCIVAHGTTNLVLAVYVKTTGQYGYW